MLALTEFVPVLCIAYILIGTHPTNPETNTPTKLQPSDSSYLWRSHHIALGLGLVSIVVYLAFYEALKYLFVSCIGGCFVGSMFGLVFAVYLTIARCKPVFALHTAVFAIAITWPLAYLFHLIPH